MELCRIINGPTLQLNHGIIMELLLNVMEISGFHSREPSNKILLGSDKMSLTIILSLGLAFLINF